MTKCFDLTISRENSAEPLTVHHGSTSAKPAGTAASAGAHRARQGWCTMDIPLFYGRKGKDTITPQQLVFWLEKASYFAGWDALQNPDQRKTLSNGTKL
jgi:hypothetical protein